MNNLNSLAIFFNIVGSSPGSTSVYEISCLSLIIGTLIVKTIVSQLKSCPSFTQASWLHKSMCMYTHHDFVLCVH